MRKQGKMRIPLKDNKQISKNINFSLKNLDQCKRIKEIFDFCQKTIISKSTRNISKKDNKKTIEPLYFKKGLPSIENRFRPEQNKQNIKLPKIIPLDYQALRLKDKGNKTKKNVKSTKNIYTEPINSNIVTLDPQNLSGKCDIKEALLQILNTQTRNSISLQQQIDKLDILTKKSGSLRRHLRSIQEDMLSLSLKKKLSKMSVPNCSLIL